MRCAAAIAKERADAGTLPKQCKGEVTKCAAKSTCGKPGFVTCCITKVKNGVPSTKCSIKSDATKCKAPKNGSACVGSVPSCCDACTDTGCAGSTTTTTSTATTEAPTTTTTLGSPSPAFLFDL